MIDDSKKARNAPKYELINRKHCHDTALRMCRDMRQGWRPNRVSGQFLDELDAKVSNIIRRAVMQHPSKGKTIMYII